MAERVRIIPVPIVSWYAGDREGVAAAQLVQRDLEACAPPPPPPQGCRAYHYTFYVPPVEGGKLLTEHWERQRYGATHPLLLVISGATHDELMTTLFTIDEALHHHELPTSRLLLILLDCAAQSSVGRLTQRGRGLRLFSMTNGLTAPTLILRELYSTGVAPPSKAQRPLGVVTTTGGEAASASVSASAWPLHAEWINMLPPSKVHLPKSGISPKRILAIALEEARANRPASKPEDLLHDRPSNIEARAHLETMQAQDKSVVSVLVVPDFTILWRPVPSAVPDKTASPSVKGGIVPTHYPVYTNLAMAVHDTWATETTGGGKLSELGQVECFSPVVVDSKWVNLDDVPTRATLQHFLELNAEQSTSKVSQTQANDMLEWFKQMGAHGFEHHEVMWHFLGSEESQIQMREALCSVLGGGVAGWTMWGETAKLHGGRYLVSCRATGENAMVRHKIAFRLHADQARFVLVQDGKVLEQWPVGHWGVDPALVKDAERYKPDRKKKSDRWLLTKAIDLLAAPMVYCEYCDENEALHACGGCHQVAYCTAECAKAHWLVGDHAMQCERCHQ